MKYSFEIHPGDLPRWNEMWAGLGGLGGLSKREANIVGDAARLNVADHFAHERSPGGDPWVPLAPMTQSQRAEGIDQRGVPFQVGAKHPILVRTKDLKRSFTDRGHPRNINEVHLTYATTSISMGAEDDVDTPDRIAILHGGGMALEWVAGAGGVGTARQVPARPFVGLSDAGVRQVDQVTRRVLGQRLERV